MVVHWVFCYTSESWLGLIGLSYRPTPGGMMGYMPGGETEIQVLCNLKEYLYCIVMIYTNRSKARNVSIYLLIGEITPTD